MTRSIRRGQIILGLLVSGCASVANTPQQEYTLESYDQCRTTAGTNQPVTLDRVQPDGRYTYRYYSGSDQRAFLDCMAAYRREHPFLDWVKTRQRGPTGALAVDPGPGVGTQLEAAGTGVPIWKVGDEWHYAYKSPSDSGSYVWSVDRIEMLDGVPHYVIKSGTREILDRVSDLASSLERVDGVVVLRETPARPAYAWPLTVGKTWEQAHRQERPVDRTTTERKSIWTVESEETVAVLAGTFRTFKITWRNKNTGALIYEMWYAPSVKQWVKIREVLTNGVREREMMRFKLN